MWLRRHACRASFGTRGANIPALLRALVACGWFGIQAWIGGEAICKILGVFLPAFATTARNALGVNLPSIVFGALIVVVVIFLPGGIQGAVNRLVSRVRHAARW